MKIKKCGSCKNVDYCLKHNPMHNGFTIEQIIENGIHVPTCGNYKLKIRDGRENMDIQKARQILNIFQDGFLGDDLLKLSDACDDLKSFINKQAEIIESLRCCGNCDLEDVWYGENGCPHRDECNKSNLSGSKSFWKPINK